MKCKYCDAEHDNETGLCNRCWELEHRLTQDLLLALKIIFALLMKGNKQ